MSQAADGEGRLRGAWGVQGGTQQGHSKRISLFSFVFSTKHSLSRLKVTAILYVRGHWLRMDYPRLARGHCQGPSVVPLTQVAEAA